MTGGHNSLGYPVGVKWWPEANEAVAWVVTSGDRKSGPSDDACGPQPADPVSRHRANRARAARRARGRVRRFCVANRCAYLWTLTFADQTDDRPHVARCVEAFIRRLRQHQRRAIPYVWVIEEHKSGKLHVHLALSIYVEQRRLAEWWSHGFVFVTGSKSERSRGRHLGAAGVARYVAKYVSKDVAGGDGRQSYRVAERFQPAEERSGAWSLEDALLRAIFAMGGERPVYVWSSADHDDDDDRAPPCWWATWNVDKV